MNITQNGAYEVTTTPGLAYLFSVSGTFGAGTVGVEYSNGDGVWTPYAGVSLTSAGEARLGAISRHARIALAGATGADLNVAMLRMEEAPDSAVLEGMPYNAGNFTGTVTLDRGNGAFQKAALTGSVTLAAPVHGSEGKALKLWLKASGADRSLDLSGAIVRPSDSGVSFPKVLSSGKMYVVLLQHNGTAWMLVSLVGGY